MKLPRRNFLYLAAGAARASGRDAHRAGASLSVAAGCASLSASPQRWRGRHRSRA